MGRMTASARGLEEVQQRFEHAANRLKPEMHDAIDLWKEDFLETARALAPVRTGEYRDSIFCRAISECEYEVGASVPWAPIIEYGSGPHMIEPIEARCLHFFLDGQEVFAMWARHPGTKPMYVIHRALWQTQPDLVGSIVKAVYISFE